VKPEDYQIWVRSGKEGTMSASAYPLFGKYDVKERAEEGQPTLKSKMSAFFK
jgi:hypothetical protein